MRMNTIETDGDGCRQAGATETCLCGKHPRRAQKAVWEDVLPLGAQHDVTMRCDTGVRGDLPVQECPWGVLGQPVPP